MLVTLNELLNEVVNACFHELCACQLLQSCAVLTFTLDGSLAFPRYFPSLAARLWDTPGSY